jgi:dTDP-4-amino-4,6-dideoxygalactose transaminase
MSRLAALPGLVVTDLSSNGMAVKLAYVLEEHGPSPDEAIAMLARHGIEAQGGYAPLHDAVAAPGGRLPETDALWKRVLTIPLETKPGRSAPASLPPRLADAHAWSTTEGTAQAALSS